jgi:Spy/CpxP family protein refolding chaperone
MRTPAILAAAVLVAAPLMGQHQHAQNDSSRHATMQMGQGMGQGHQMMAEMMGPMLKSMAFAPAHLLDRKDVLELTPQQITRLTAIRDAAKQAHDAAHHDAQAHMAEVGKAMQAAAPDTAAVKMHFQGAHTAMGKAHWTMLAAAAQARALLTDRQRGRVEGWGDKMGEGHEEQ